MSNRWLRETIIVTIIWISVLILLGMVADGKQMVHPADRATEIKTIECDYVIFRTNKVLRPQKLGFFGAAQFDELTIYCIGRNRFGVKCLIGKYEVDRFPEDSMLMNGSNRKFKISWQTWGNVYDVECDEIFEVETREERKAI